MAVKKKTEQKNAAQDQYIYIGPTLPGKLKSNVVLRGNIRVIKAYYQDIITKYPQVNHLIISVKKLGEARDKVKTPGNLLYIYYTELIQSMSQKEA